MTSHLHATGPAEKCSRQGKVGQGWEAVWSLASLSLAEERESALNIEICQNSVSNPMLRWADILLYAYICIFGNSN